MADDDPVLPWLADDEPFDEDQSRAQVASVLTVLDELQSSHQESDASGTSEIKRLPPCVLELGCGGGRVLVPVAAAGYHVTGIDCNPEAIQRCRVRSNVYRERVTLVEGDFRRDPWPTAPASSGRSGQFDAILLLGNTLMTLTTIDEAVSLFSTAASHLTPGGVFLIDDIAGCFWPELTEGNWQSGLSEDGGMQLIWHPRDTLFTIRLGEQVDTDAWELRASDRLFRLWTSSLLGLVARAAGLSEPHHPHEHVLSIMRRK